MPLYLHAWGPVLYGEWLTLAAAVGYLCLMDLGLQLYVVNRLNACWSRWDRDTYTRILHSALAWTTLLGVLAVALGVGAITVSPLIGALDFVATSSRSASWVLLLLALQIGLSLPQGLLCGIYRTIGEYARGVMIANAQRVAGLLLTIAVLLAGGGLVAVAFAQVLPFAAVVAWVLADLRRRHPEIDVGYTRGDLRLALQLLGPTALFFLVQGTLVLTLQGSVLLVQSLVGAAAVAVFVSLRTLANVGRQLAGIVSNVLWPEMTALDARGERATLRNAHLLAAKLNSAVCLAVGLFLHLLGAGIVALWTRGELLYDASVMNALVAWTILQAPWVSCMYVLLACNRHRRLAFLCLASSTCGLALAVPMIAAFGTVGVVYGIGLADLAICGVLVPIECCRFLQQPFRRFVGTLFGRGALVVGLLALGATWVRPWLPARPDLLQLGLGAVLCTLAVFAATWSLWLEEDERIRLARFAHRFTRNSRHLS